MPTWETKNQSMSEKLNRVGGDKAVRETLTNHLFYTEGCVWLVLDPVWIGLTEQVLIAVYLRSGILLLMVSLGHTA